MGLRFLIMVRSLHLLSLKARPEAADHGDIVQILLESGAIILRLHFPLHFSVICKHCHFAMENRIWKVVHKKRAGPSIEPCGTPEVTGKSHDVTPSTVTHWHLPQRYA